MKNLARTIFFHSPKSIRRFITARSEKSWLRKSLATLSCDQRKEFGTINSNNIIDDINTTIATTHGKKIKVLFYHIDGLSFGGTEKFLQIIAKYLNPEKFDIVYMHATKSSDLANIQMSQNQTIANLERNKDRTDYMTTPHIKLLRFTYDSVEKMHPYIIHGMKPTIAKVIADEKIDLVFAATPGHTIFPLNLLHKIPIVNVNIFGSFMVQENIKAIINLSQEIFNRSTLVSNPEINSIMYIPSERPLPKDESAAEIRRRFGIAETDFVLGRIGRPSDDIFDPIALDGFKKFSSGITTSTHSESKDATDNTHNSASLDSSANPAAQNLAAKTHFIIMAPSPKMIAEVKDEQIPNVHFIEPSARQTDVFAFHNTIDCLAHSRLDGETSGLNISESMLCGNPILTHKSHIWNAHLEYLDPSFSRIANKDDSDAYAKHIQEFANIFFNNTEGWNSMRNASKTKAEALFLMDSNIAKIENIIEAVIAHTTK